MQVRTTASAIRPLLLIAFVLFGASKITLAAKLHQQRQLRRPVALVAVEDRLYVADRRSGTISVIDAAAENAEIFGPVFRFV